MSKSSILESLTDALRTGHQLAEPIPVKWAGLAISVLGWVIAGVTSYVAARGWFPVEVSSKDAMDLAFLIVAAFSGAGASAFSVLATTKKIGILPPKDDGDTGVVK